MNGKPERKLLCSGREKERDCKNAYERLLTLTQLNVFINPPLFRRSVIALLCRDRRIIGSWQEGSHYSNLLQLLLLNERAPLFGLPLV
jgi:hypothetical protein